MDLFISAYPGFHITEQVQDTYIYRLDGVVIVASQKVIDFAQGLKIIAASRKITDIKTLVSMGVVKSEGTSNAVNLTDGLDGLAIGPVLITAATFMVLAYLAGNVKIASYLQIPYVPGSRELTVFCVAMVGASMGFLWFNTYPAEVFMGDTGSVSLGAALGAAAVISKQEILLAIVGGLFVLETLSVIFQVTSYKLRGKRIFRMAPLHHHFELEGWAEPKVIVRFWIMTIFLALVAFGTLKLR